VEEKREEEGVLIVLWSWVRDSNWLRGKRLSAASRHSGILLESQFDILLHESLVDHRDSPSMEKHPSRCE